MIAATMTVDVVDLIGNQFAAYTTHEMCDRSKKFDGEQDTTKEWPKFQIIDFY